jgi:hypothetical protein
MGKQRTFGRSKERRSSRRGEKDRREGHMQAITLGKRNRNSKRCTLLARASTTEGWRSSFRSKAITSSGLLL